MSVRNLTILFPFAFAAHNLEEAWVIGKLGVSTPMPVTLPQFIVAVSLFTLLGFAIVFWRGYRGWRTVVTAFAGALFLNTFFPHIIVALYFGRYVPGLISAVILILPLTSAILWKIHKAHWFSPRRFFATILLGGMSGALLIPVFLGVGYLLTC